MEKLKTALVFIGFLLSFAFAIWLSIALDSDWGISIAFIPWLIYEFWGWWVYRFNQVIDFFRKPRTLGEWFELSIMWICISFVVVWIYFAGQ